MFNGKPSQKELNIINKIIYTVMSFIIIIIFLF